MNPPDTLYTSQLQAGLGMIPETLEILQLWEPEISPSQLAERVISEGLFSRATARRAHNLVTEMFAPRFLSAGGEAASRIKFLQEHHFPREAIAQLCFLYTARAQRIFRDFVVEIYWPRYSGGATMLTQNDAKSFVLQALDSGRMVKRWSESTISRVSGYLLGCCADFGLVGEAKRLGRPIRRFAIRPDVALYLVHDLHFSGLSDKAILQHPDCFLFGFHSGEILTILKTLSNDGHFLIQSGAELVQISWKYPSMDACLHALTQR